MDENDKPEFVRILNGLAAVKRVDLTAEAYAMWWGAMHDWTIDDFRAAAGHLLKHCEFMPSPYDFENLQRAHEPSAREAWSDALAFALGAWRNGAHDDARIESVVRALGGWSVIAFCDVKNLGFVERRFVETYQDFSDSAEARKALPNHLEQTKIRHGKAKQIGEIVKQF